MGVPKIPRTSYFKMNPWVKEIRNAMGHDAFDKAYRAVYKFTSSLHPGQFFFVRDLCKKDPRNHELVVRMLDIFYHMDFFEDFDYDVDTDKVTRNRPQHTIVMKWPYQAPDVFSQIIKNPERWGINKEDIL